MNYRVRNSRAVRAFERWVLAALIAWLICVAPSTAMAENRVALVIGNGNYKGLPPLANPPSDAKDVADALKSLGFTVTLAVDADRARMQGLIEDFGKSAASADVSLFYYGGHGMQVASQNYLVPVDAQLRDVDDIEKRTIHYDDVQDAQAKGPGIHLVFLDACRTNPLKDSNAALRSSGLARVEKKPGFLTVFATTPDNVAFDGAGRNSPFAQALLNHMATPGVDVSSMMIAVRNDVFASSGGAQLPYESSSLTRQFYFAGDGAGDASPEAALWRLAASQRDPNLLTIYLDKYPTGPHAADVRALMGGSAMAKPKPKGETALENDLWRLALSARARSLSELYLARFPMGAHVQEANALLASLKASEIAGKDPAVTCEQLATLPSDGTPSVPGTDLATLRLHAPQALDACRQAVAAHPEAAHYVELLARAAWASDSIDEAIKLHRQAADAGDARAMVSLGFLLETGNHMPQDIKGAYALFETAAAKGNPDAAINLGYALAKGDGVKKDLPRALQLFRQASLQGSVIAKFDLAGLLNEQGEGAQASEAFDLLKQAANEGYARAHLAKAIMLDAGRGAPRDPTAAADELLQCVVADAGECLATLTDSVQKRSPDTIKALQARLKTAGYYAGPIDGRSGPSLAPALKQWRLLGQP